MKSKIFITYPDSYKYFKSKLPTGQKGYCEIMRNVTVEPDPNNVYDCWGTIEAYGQKLSVYAHDYEGEEKLWQISGVARKQQP
jgi:hypothetical protein